jgi:hypothetical protein
MSKPGNGQAEGNPERAAIADLARALGLGSAKLHQALVLTFGKDDSRSVRASLVDQQLQPLVAELVLPLA